MLLLMSYVYFCLILLCSSKPSFTCDIVPKVKIGARHSRLPSIYLCSQIRRFVFFPAQMLPEQTSIEQKSEKKFFFFFCSFYSYSNTDHRSPSMLE